MTDQHRNRQDRKYQNNLKIVVREIRQELRNRNIKFEETSPDEIWESHAFTLKNVSSSFKSVSISAGRKAGGSFYYCETDVIVTVKKYCGYERASGSRRANFRQRKDGSFSFDKIVDNAQVYARELRSEIRTKAEIDRLDKARKLDEKKALRKLKINKKVKASQNGDGSWSARVDLGGLNEESLMILSDAVKQIRETA